MKTVTVCVGSSCHIKGSRKLITDFSRLLEEQGLADQVELKGAFCMERCGKGLNWQIGDTPITSASAEDAVNVLREWLAAHVGIAGKTAGPPLKEGE